MTAPIPAQDVTVDWQQWLDEHSTLVAWQQSGTDRHLTVVLGTDLPVDHPALPSLLDVDKIVVTVETFVDGRMFGLARLLRHRLGFDGVIEARGDYLPDQVSFMKRCGFDAFDKADSVAAAAEYYSAFYQPLDEGKEKTVSIRRARMQQDFSKKVDD